jgi:hypothetical protein
MSFLLCVNPDTNQGGGKNFVQIPISEIAGLRAFRSLYERFPMTIERLTDDILFTIR